MSQEPWSGAPGAIVQPIRTSEKSYAFRSIAGLTYATLAGVGVNAAVLLFQFVAFYGQWRVLGEAGGPDPSADTGLADAAQQSDALVALSALLALPVLVITYVIASFWIYNAACNARALGARGFQVSPGWAVGWWAIPFASLVMPFVGMAEIYKASASPAGWRLQSTPLLLRAWWAAWLVAGIGGSLISLMARIMTEEVDLATLTLLQLGDIAVDLLASAFFALIVWQVFRAQVLSRTHGGVAQVFA